MNAQKKKETQANAATPDEIQLNTLQAARLAKLSGVSVKELEGRTIADLSERLKWKIDPSLFFFRRICGKVVKTDPVTGVDHPVPFATVHVMDTDCSFLGFFPVESPWAWFFPIFCHQEEIGTTTTDACGNFCVWVPRFEIDRILQWRFEWRCYPELFLKPSIRDILKYLEIIEREPHIPPHGPGPDPAPILTKDPAAIQRLGELIGAERARMLSGIARSADFTGNISALQEVLDQPAFPEKIPPPIPKQLHILQEQHKKEGSKAIQAHFGEVSERQYSLNLRNYIGPFPRWFCRWELVSEIVPILDVPDITFTVTQDVDGDGTQETIYSEGFFDVRWNAGIIPNVTLHATQNAVSTFACDPMTGVDCTELGAGVGIASVGLLPLSGPAMGTPYYDPTTGYGRRPNPPHTDGAIRASTLLDRPATAPFARTLLLRGCNQVPNAQFYRMWYKFNGGADTPFLNQSWPIFRPLGSTPTWVVPDVNGWYPVLPDPANWLIPDLLFAWRSYLFSSGDYEVWVEMGDAGKNHLTNSAAVKLKVDNSSPQGEFLSLAWRVAQNNTLPCTDPSWTPLSLACPVVRRPAQDIEFCVTWQASASHLRDAELSARGCGAASSVLTRTTGIDTVQHWHTGELDNNTGIRSAIYRLNYASGPADNQGAYTFSLAAYSRAFDPSDSTGYVADWLYDIFWYGGQVAYLPVAVVNA